MSRRPRAKFPWERDSGDLEANYRRPVPFHERARLGLKGAIVVGSYFAIKQLTRDRTDVGAELLLVIGSALVVVGIMDLVWTWRGKLEHVFIESRSGQLLAHAGLTGAGLAMAAAGLVMLR